jgi:2-methylcitrate dehydratase PrpD
MAARQALTAVTLAKRGLTGPVDPFFAPRGYFAQYTRAYDLAFLTEGLGKRWLTTGYHKAYPSCYGCHAVAEACATLATRLPDGLDAVTGLIIEMWSDTAESFLTQPFAPGDSQAKALFNIRYAAARALQSGGLSPADFGDQALNDPRTQALIRCVRIDPSLPWDWGHGVAARVHVDLANGSRLTAEVPRSLGFPGRALSDSDLADKFCSNLRHAGIDDIETVEAALSGLQQIEDIADLGELAPRLRACHAC